MRSFLRSVSALAIAVIFTPVHAAWQPAGLQGSNVLSLAEDPTSGSTWFAGTADGFVYKKAGAGEWVVASTGLPPGRAVLALGVNPANPAILYAGLEGAGIYKSTDGATTWSASGLDALSVASIALDPYNPSIVFAAANGQMYRSVDAGSTWDLVTSAALGSANVQRIVFNPPDATQNPPPTQEDTIYAAAFGGLFRSVDAGSTWILLDTAASGIASTSFTTIAIDPQNRPIVYAGTADAGMYRSADGGSSWTEIGTGLGTADVLAITPYPYAPTGLLVGTGAGGVYRTDTSGLDWYAWNEGNAATRVNAIAFLAPEATSILAATSDGVVSFDNSGPDLVVTSVSGPASANTEGTITVTATVRNVGAGTSSRGSYTGIYLSTDSTITTSDTNIGYCWAGYLAAGAEHTCTIQYTVPWNLTGTYYIGAIADFWNHEIDETDEANNARTGNQITLTRVTFPDLLVTSVSGPASGNPGGTIAVTATVRNQGTGKSHRGSYTGIYLSTDSTITTSDTNIGYCWAGYLAAGAEHTCTIQYTVPWNLTGAYYIGAIADFWNHEIDETDEANNAGTGNQITLQ